MPRDLVLGNGTLLVCLDRNLFIRDLYWPYVGLYNHLSGHAIRFGVYADKVFGWVDDRWDKTLLYRPHSQGDYYARVSDDLANVPGNPWIICTLWRAQWLIKTATSRADLEAPSDLLELANLCALPSGVLPEQTHPYTFVPLTVAPLTWSHSEVVETVYRWLQKRAQLGE